MFFSYFSICDLDFYSFTYLFLICLSIFHLLLFLHFFLSYTSAFELQSFYKTCQEAHFFELPVVLHCAAFMRGAVDSLIQFVAESDVSDSSCCQMCQPGTFESTFSFVCSAVEYAWRFLKSLCTDVVFFFCIFPLKAKKIQLGEMFIIIYFISLMIC